MNKQELNIAQYERTVEQNKQLQQELKSYKKENLRLKEELGELKSDILNRVMCIKCETAIKNCELESELEKYRDMAKKGLDEFKDIGGCWGCGLQLQLNQDIQDIKQLKAECERLKEESEKTEETAISLLNIQNELAKSCVIYKQALEEIRVIAEEGSKSVFADEDCDKIIDKINEVIGVE